MRDARLVYKALTTTMVLVTVFTLLTATTVLGNGNEMASIFASMAGGLSMDSMYEVLPYLSERTKSEFSIGWVLSPKDIPQFVLEDIGKLPADIRAKVPPQILEKVDEFLKSGEIPKIENSDQIINQGIALLSQEVQKTTAETTTLTPETTTTLPPTTPTTVKAATKKTETKKSTNKKKTSSTKKPVTKKGATTKKGSKTTKKATTKKKSG